MEKNNGKNLQSDFFLDLASFEDFRNGEDNREKIKKLTVNLKDAIDAELTNRQKEMVKRYYFNNEKIPEIAKTLGLNKSSVSRTLKRARKNLLRVLRYTV